MKLHEYQAKQIFARYGVPVPKGTPVFEESGIEPAAKALIDETGSDIVVVKAQIHAGGRGKGGGVKVCKGLSDDYAPQGIPQAFLKDSWGFLRDS